MSERISPTKIEDYHAHIYYSADTRDLAAEVRGKYRYQVYRRAGKLA
jgi:aromatic ring-cleaving dioxygenase